MRNFLPNRIWITVLLFLIVSFSVCSVHAETASPASLSIDRVQLVKEQISLLNNRLNQAKVELESLQLNEKFSQLALEKASKNLLDKASLDIIVTQSNLDSINIELIDSQQTSNWLEKNIQEIENQLNILNIFGLKTAPNEASTLNEYRLDLNYQLTLLKFEKNRVTLLQELQKAVNNILNLRNDRFNQLTILLKTKRLVHIKQQQVKDELAYQQLQNHWLQQLNALYGKLSKVDPVQSKSEYSALERDIYYANEQASFAYVQSLLARYKDQIQQMKLAVTKSNSISLLNEISNQMQTLSKQIDRLDKVLKSRTQVLAKHIDDLAQKKSIDVTFKVYLSKLSLLNRQYKSSDLTLVKLKETLLSFRKTLDEALQIELSARQGLPTLGLKTFVDLGKEMLLLPALSFQVIKSLSTNLGKAVQGSGVLAWSLFALAEIFWFAIFIVVKTGLNFLQERQTVWKDQINSKWLSLQLVQRNFVDLMVLANAIGILYFFKLPIANYLFVIYMALVWLACKALLSLARISLVETTHHSAGHDVRLYHRLRWVIVVGGMITSLTVFVHQLPLIYELKALCNHLFLLLLMVISILLMRSSDVIPSLILSNMESRHPYLEKSIRLVGMLVPAILLANSVIGLLGFVNLVLTMSWYEGVFLVVLIGYLVVRGFLSDAMEQLSRMMIQYVNNGWLWTEAFLKPLDKVLRITLFLTAWAVLFLLYGWDKQSPIVERLTRLLQYQLVSVANTVITPLNIIELFVVVSIFYWTAKWTREFVYRMLLSRTKDMGIRNSIAILSQYCVVILGLFICLRVLGIDLSALTVVAGMFAFGIGLGLRDLANNFASGFLLLFERPLRVGDIVNISGYEGEVTHIGGRAVTIRTWDHMELLVPNAEVFNKSFTNWTAMDNIVRSIVHVKISRYDNPHEVKVIIQNVLAGHKEILIDPMPEVLLKEMSDTLMEFEMRFYVNIRQVKSRVSVISAVLMDIWDAFAKHGIKAPYPQHEIFLRSEQHLPLITLDENPANTRN
ncbi:MAG: mechanosensitive ion channel [Gammaproteobacteria bacterium]|nr:mechanosensitive ion channel [Gammaproteobacteria bacterium]